MRNSPIVRVDSSGHFGDANGYTGGGNPGATMICLLNEHGDCTSWSRGSGSDQEQPNFSLESGGGLMPGYCLGGECAGGGSASQQSNASKSPTPETIQDNIRKTADDYGVPEEIALGLVNKESHFDPTLVGGHGEVGLFQINPNHNGEKVTDAHGNSMTIDIKKAGNPSEWQYNVQVGMALLKKDYEWAKANVPKDVVAATFAHYNAHRNWKYYKVRNSPVHYHVYGRWFRNAQGHRVYDKGYMDYYHDWGGK